MNISSKFNGRRSVLAQSLAFALALPFGMSAMAQQATPAATPAAEEEEAAEPAKQLEQVVVTGSRIKRSQIEGPSPVTIITAEQIQKEGFNTVFDALETVSQNTGFAQNDFNAAGGFTPNASVINLRGMGPGRTLLLVNGRRANDYPFPYNGRSNFQNFSNIPAGAVDRIEILAGGASAIYGSDAVAGVVNVVLKKNYEGNLLRLKGQTSTDGGHDIADFQWTGGKTGDNWSLTYAFESYNVEPTFAHQRHFMDSGADNPAPPGVGGSAGFGGYQPPIGIQIRGQGIPTAGSYRQPLGYDCSASPLFRAHTYVSTASGATLGPGCGYDRFPAEQTIANGANDLSGYLYGTYTFDNNVEIWGSLMAYHSRGRLGGGVEQWFGQIPNATFYDPQFGIRILPIRVLTPESYPGMNGSGTFQQFDEKSYDMAAGLRGTWADRFDWDLTVGGARYHALRDRPRMTIAGATAFFLGNRLGTTGAGQFPGVPAGVPIYRLNLDNFYGPITPADYASMSTIVHYDAESENSAANFVVSGDLFELPAGPVAFAAMAEFSTQSYTLNTDRRILPGTSTVYNLTGTGGGGERDRYAVGAEFSIPVFESLTATVAGRFDRYDDITDVDDAKTWNAGLEWRPLDNLLIRGSYATSFKAPDMHYIFAERSGSFGTVIDYLRCFNAGINPAVCSGAGGVYNYAAFTTSEGQPTLSEETGNSWTAGVVWDIIDDLALSVDYYEIELENVVSVQTGTAILEGELGCNTGFYPNGQPYPFALGSEFCNATLSRIDRDPISGAITEIRSGPINLAFQGTKGIDASLRYRWDTDRWGNFTTSVQWSHVLEQTSKATPNAAMLSYRDLNSNADIRSRVRANLSWSKNDWDATIFMSRMGSFPIWNPGNTRVATEDLNNRIAPFLTWNLTIGKKITDKLGLRMNVNNVFDAHHPDDLTNNAYPYFYQIYNHIGREVGFEVTYKLD